MPSVEPASLLRPRTGMSSGREHREQAKQAKETPGCQLPAGHATPIAYRRRPAPAAYGRSGSSPRSLRSKSASAWRQAQDEREGEGRRAEGQPAIALVCQHFAFLELAIAGEEALAPTRETQDQPCRQASHLARTDDELELASSWRRVAAKSSKPSRRRPRWHAWHAGRLVPGSALIHHPWSPRVIGIASLPLQPAPYTAPLQPPACATTPAPATRA